MSWFYYLLEANLYLILFYGFYILFLQKETFYEANRYFLILSTVLSFVFPLLKIGYFNPVLPNFIPDDNFIPYTTDAIDIQQSATTQSNLFHLPQLLLIGYGLVILVLLSKTIAGLFKINKILKRSTQKAENGITIVELQNSKFAFSFFNLLFIDPLLPQRNIILKHEMVHIKQKHSYDILFFEFVQIINWFNPAIYLIKKEIRTIHEYLADEQMTERDDEKYDYAMFLIQNSQGINVVNLTNQMFSTSILKKRINMLNQKKSSKWSRLRLLLTLPLIGGIVSLSTMAFTKDYGIVELYSGKNQAKMVIRQDTVKKAFSANGIDVPDLSTVYFAYRFNATLQKPMPVSKRLFVINDKEIEAGTVGGVKNIDHIILLNPQNGVKKYGEKGKNGVIEVHGSKANILDIPSPPPMEPASPPQPPRPPKPPKKGTKITSKIGKPGTELPPPLAIEPNPALQKNNVAIGPPPAFSKISLNRAKSESLVIPDSDFDNKTLTVYNEKGKVVYNTTDYQNDWNGKKGNYGKYVSTLPAGKYQFLMKIAGKPLLNKRGIINITN